jgi:hypothetical protein
MAVVIAPSPAHAGDGDVWHAYTKQALGWPWNSGMVQWEEDGDVLSVWDDAPDGASVIAQTHYNYGSLVTYRNARGVNTVKWFDLELPEDKRFTFRACAQDDGVVIEASCSNWMYANT